MCGKVASGAKDFEVFEVQHFDAQMIVNPVMYFQMIACSAAFARRLEQTFQFGGLLPFGRLQPLRVFHAADERLELGAVNRVVLKLFDVVTEGLLEVFGVKS